jgi:uncharacterized protein involved in exopolysaccharide biosynthesis
MPDRQTIDPVKVLALLVHHRRILLVGAATAALASGALSMLLPKHFVSRSSILPLPPLETQLPLSDTVILPMDSRFFGFSSQTDLHAEMLESRSVMSGIVSALNLIDVFGLDDRPEPLRMELAIKKLRNMIDISKSLAGVIEIKVTAKTGAAPFLRPSGDQRARELAASIANEAVNQLADVVREKTTSRARSARRFIEDELLQTSTDLQAAADSLRFFQERNLTVSLDEQARVMVETAADFQAKIVAKEIELAVYRRTMTPENPQILSAQSEVRAMRDEYSKLMLGGDADGAKESEYSLPLARLPRVAQEYALRLRDVKIKEGVYELLNQLYYRASIEEASDIPSIQALDMAVPAIRKSAPKRGFIVVSAIVLVLALLSVRIVVNTGVENVRRS